VKDIKNAGGSAPIHFTDVRYCKKRTGSDLPKDTVKAAVRRISDAARRKASTGEEAVAAMDSLTDSMPGTSIRTSPSVSRFARRSSGRRRNVR
jgi:hypothetical protein